MRWLKPNLRSIYGLLGQVPPAPMASEESRVNDVRQAMLDCMPGRATTEHRAYVVRKITYADGAEDLWYVRTALMGVLSEEVGETVAQSKIASLTKLFKGLLPDGMIDQTSKRPK